MARSAIRPATVNEAKMRLRQVSQRPSYLEPVLKHPLEAAAGAFLSGLFWKQIGRKAVVSAAMKLGLSMLKR